MLMMQKLSIAKSTAFFVLLMFFGAGSATEVAAQTTDIPEKIAPIDAPFEMPDLKRPDFPDNTFTIVDYGAARGADNQAETAKAIRKTIEAAYKAGGGKVLIPEGEWWTGPIHLRSNINLHVVENADVHFSKDKEDYLPVVRQRPEGVEAFNYSPLIYARNVKNVAITGKGTLHGHGKHWWEWADNHSYTHREKATKVPLSQRKYGKGAGEVGMRPNFVVFWKSRNILVEGITLKNSPMWNINPVYSQNIIVRGITVLSKKAPNGDGINPSSCKNVLIEYNHFETGDDAVVLKSGLNEEGLKIDIPTKNVVVRHYKAIDVRTGSGGIVFGSETSGGIENVYVHDAYFEGTDKGIRFKTERGRGNVVENIYIHDIEMKDLDHEGITFNTYYSGPGVTGPSPLIRNIEIRNVTIDGVPRGIHLRGLPDKWLENFTFENISVKNSVEGIRISRTKGLTLKNVSIHSERRAMEASDVFELNLQGLKLGDESGKAPLLIKGSESGAVFIHDFPTEKITFGEGASAKIIR